MPRPFIDYAAAQVSPPQPSAAALPTYHLFVAVATVTSADRVAAPAAWAATLHAPDATERDRLNSPAATGALGHANVRDANVLGLLHALRFAHNNVGTAHNISVAGNNNNNNSASLRSSTVPSPPPSAVTLVVHCAQSPIACVVSASIGEPGQLPPNSSVPAPPPDATQRLCALAYLVRRVADRFGAVRPAAPAARSEDDNDDDHGDDDTDDNDEALSSGADGVWLERMRELAEQKRRCMAREAAEGTFRPARPGLVAVRVNGAATVAGSHDTLALGADGRTYVDLRLLWTLPAAGGEPAGGGGSAMRGVEGARGVQTVQALGRRLSVVGEVTLELRVEWPGGPGMARRADVRATVVDWLPVGVHVSTRGAPSLRPGVLLMGGLGALPFDGETAGAYYDGHPFWAEAGAGSVEAASVGAGAVDVGVDASA